MWGNFSNPLYIWQLGFSLKRKEKNWKKNCADLEDRQPLSIVAQTRTKSWKNIFYTRKSTLHAEAPTIYPVTQLKAEGLPDPMREEQP